jgi:hypothetical protein
MALRVCSKRGAGAARVLSQWFGATVEPVVRFNGKRRASATVTSLAASLRATGAAMDPDKDVLALVLTSHG